MSIQVSGLISWLKNWFYDKDQIDGWFSEVYVGVTAVGSFTIDNNGHLIVTLPDGMANPYSINSNGHLIYDTSAVTVSEEE